LPVVGAGAVDSASAVTSWCPGAHPCSIRQLYALRSWVMPRLAERPQEEVVVNEAANTDGRLPGVLVGGPTDIPDDVRACRVGAEDRRLKVVRLGGYEHFERVEGDGRADGPNDGPVVFRWVTRTKIAE
jgi:hypothetical protein